MSVIAVAGGLGDLGRLIVNALLETGKHEVYILSRKDSPENNNTTRTSPLTGNPYQPLLQANYASVSHLTTLLTTYKIDTVISTLIMDSPASSNSQLNLIRAAELSPATTRFLPSEFNVEYDQPDSVLPYPEKRFHLAAREELNLNTKTLEYGYVYPGMFMDYFGMPNVKTVLRPLYFFMDPVRGKAVLPGDGEGRMSMCFTEDAARFVAWSLDLEMGTWGRGRVMSCAVCTVSLNELVGMVDDIRGKKMEVKYQDVERLLRREPVEDLQANVEIAEVFTERFPGGLGQVRALVADLEASVALGAYDLETTCRLGKEKKRAGGGKGGWLDLVEVFRGREPKPRGIEEVLAEAWGRLE